MTSRIGIKFPTRYAWGSNSPPLGRLKRSNAQGMPEGGMLKLQFERYIIWAFCVFQVGLSSCPYLVYSREGLGPRVIP